ncbi:hypothetical protein J7E93_08130 [Streptomyces sp. ISL-36]|uniref:DUF4344 domain-containing metallopeptidase n=1 Tax=Streptomyces sp. ISL-36 TaxID=2819182 RepID=UPI001BE7B72E|nr:DUF4344 domain-containing metallopeptidase [Streptomyces sp. ISL-36]MBT2440086.1 hypothetical protein [Streptomyces sp. ISL-36]
MFRKRHAAVAAALAVTLVSAGCSASQERQLQQRGVAARRQGDYTFVPRYTEPRKNRDRPAEQLLRENGVLEELSEYGTSLLKLPKNIPVLGQSCGQVNLSWDADGQRIVMCYEMVTFLAQMFEAADKKLDKPQGVTPKPEQYEKQVIGALNGMFFHEMGHGVIDIYDLPSTGREEDAVDQLAAVILIADGDTGQDYLRDMAAAFALLGGVEEVSIPADARYSDEHSLSEQRFYNLLCYQYGAHPEKYSDLVPEPLPKERAEQCPEEYDKAASAWSRLLQPHLKG